MLLKAALSDGPYTYKNLQLKENNHASLSYTGYLIKWKMCIDFKKGIAASWSSWLMLNLAQHEEKKSNCFN